MIARRARTSLRLRWPSELVTRRSLGGDGIAHQSCFRKALRRMDGGVFASPKRLRPRRRVDPGHDAIKFDVQ